MIAKVKIDIFLLSFGEQNAQKNVVDNDNAIQSSIFGHLVQLPN